MKKLLFFLFVSGIFLSMCSCSDDGFKEYTNPMDNNPVNALPWLKEIKESLKQKESSISLFNYKGNEYYFVQLPRDEVPSIVVYDKDGKEFFYIGGLIPGEYAELYEDFMDNAQFIATLWSNSSK